MNPLQVTYRGVTIGDGTAYDIIQGTGFDDLPAIKSQDVDRARDFGQFQGVDLASGREITLQLEVLGVDDPTFRANLDAWIAATVPTLPAPGTSAEAVLQFQMPGWSGPRQASVRPRVRTAVLDMNYVFRHASLATRFWATDPRIYDASQQSVVLPVGVAGSGMTFNAGFNLSFGSGATSGSAILGNAGNTPTYPVITIAGPVDNPTIENATAGAHLTFQSLTINAGDTLVIDMIARSALYFVGGTSVGGSRRSFLTTDSQWWSLAPGNSTVNYRANTVQVGSTATVVFRSAWL